MLYIGVVIIIITFMIIKKLYLYKKGKYIMNFPTSSLYKVFK